MRGSGERATREGGQESSFSMREWTRRGKCYPVRACVEYDPAHPDTGAAGDAQHGVDRRYGRPGPGGRRPARSPGHRPRRCVRRWRHLEHQDHRGAIMRSLSLTLLIPLLVPPGEKPGDKPPAKGEGKPVKDLILPGESFLV